ncbi:MAG: lipopolysaccharide biosynthesis protein, partial [Thermoproteota archaeon]
MKPQETESLKKRTLKGIVWTAISNFGQQGIQFVVTIILARLLTPKDFGLVGIASIFIGLAAVVNQLGIGAALVQRKD